MTTLGDLLLNPPLVGGDRTIRHLRVAAELLGCDNVEIANLFAIATRDVTAINDVGRSIDGWKAAQFHLHRLIAASDQLIAGWGISGLTGPVERHRQAQVDFVRACALDIGKDHIWTVNGEPRHPSRWHQYVSDRRGRACGTTLNQRLSMVLTSVPFVTLWPESVAETR